MNEQHLLNEIKTWAPKAQEEFANRISRLQKGERRIWYCQKGRSCNGKPHQGVEYKHARGDQWPPGGVDWTLWFLRGGRGSGKTRTASEWVRKITQYAPLISCVGIDTRRIRQTMIEGPSGLVRICEAAGVEYLWEPSKREFTFLTGPGSGAKAIMYSAEEPDSLRGPEHAAAWLDEPSHYPLIDDVWSNLMLGLRMRGMPGGVKAVATSTPLNNEWTRKRSADPSTRTVVVPTYKNLDNLDPAYAKILLAEFEGTRLGRQELYGEILEDVIGALWANSIIGYVTAADAFKPEDCERIVIGIDPAGSVDAKRDETGIVVVGCIGEQYYVLQDASGHYTPNGWATKAVDLANSWGAEALIAERNYGGQMVEHTIKTVDPTIRVRTVYSRRGKALRAEPIVGRYEQERVKHLHAFSELELQMTSWVPASGPSPDRVDALVHALTELGAGARAGSIAAPNLRLVAAPSNGLPPALAGRR